MNEHDAQTLHAVVDQYHNIRPYPNFPREDDILAIRPRLLLNIRRSGIPNYLSRSPSILFRELTVAIPAAIQDATELVATPEYVQPADGQFLLAVAVDDCWLYCHADVDRLRGYASAPVLAVPDLAGAYGNALLAPREGWRTKAASPTLSPQHEQPGQDERKDPAIDLLDLTLALGWDAMNPPFKLSAVHRLGTEGSVEAWRYIEGVLSRL